MRLTLLLLLLILTPTIKAQVSEDIKINQMGFFPTVEKLAIVVNSTASSFQISVFGSTQAVYSGQLTNALHWEESNEEVKIADFSDFDVSGKFQLYVDGKGFSHPFVIGDHQALSISKATIKALYYNRASTAIEAQYGDTFTRLMGHPDNQVIIHPSAATKERPAGTIISTPKGWYDAGDYNKYVVNSGITTFSYLSLYERFSPYFDTLNLNIPESNNKIPDILDEALWNIQWISTMQDPNDGGVYNKTTTANFEGALMPDKAISQRYVVSKGTAATLDFAAVMAMAARIYKPFDAKFAAVCLAKAEFAWQWANAHPDVIFTNPVAQDGYPAIQTGGYGDKNFTDEFLWAATELYITTLKDKYYLEANYNQQFQIPNWSNVQTLALISLSIHKDKLTSATKEVEFLNPLIKMAQQLLETSNIHPYRIPKIRYAWGSNSEMGNAGVIFLIAYELTKNKDYFNAAMRTYDYLLGKNATSYSFITGFGSKMPTHIHHRVSEADGVSQPIPGFLAGGPNPNNQNQDCGSQMYPTQLAAKSYLDDFCSFSTNEIAINWNAPISYLSGGLQYIYLRDFKKPNKTMIDKLGIE